MSLSYLKILFEPKLMGVYTINLTRIFKKKITKNSSLTLFYTNVFLICRPNLILSMITESKTNTTKLFCSILYYILLL